MATTVYITVEDVNDQMDTYTSIQLYRASTVDGAYSLVTTITLVADDTYYEYADSGGTSTSWYRYRFYNATGPVNSSYSNPTQPAANDRLGIRQFAIQEYDAGLVLTQSATAGSTTTVVTDDYRYKNNKSAGRAKSGWIHPASGLRAGETRTISADVPSTGIFTVTPAMTGALATDDQFEWHWLVDVNTWNLCINRAMKRYMFLERVPIVGAGTRELALNYLPWLTSRNQICSLWYYPSSSDLEQPWGGNTQWWSARQDQGYVTLMTSPVVSTSQTLYLEALRNGEPLWTDDSIVPAEVVLELIAALAYDEVLAWLLRPGSTAAESDKSVYKVQRDAHAGHLKRLWNAFGPRPRYQRQQLHQPSSASVPWSARG